MIPECLCDDGLNPYSTGTNSTMLMYSHSELLICLSLNPYSTGTNSTIELRRKELYNVGFVLIFILLEQTLRLLFN